MHRLKLTRSWSPWISNWSATVPLAAVPPVADPLVAGAEEHPAASIVATSTAPASAAQACDVSRERPRPRGRPRTEAPGVPVSLVGFMVVVPPNCRALRRHQPRDSGQPVTRLSRASSGSGLARRALPAERPGHGRAGRKRLAKVCDTGVIRAAAPWLHAGAGS